MSASNQKRGDEITGSRGFSIKSFRVFFWLPNNKNVVQVLLTNCTCGVCCLLSLITANSGSGWMCSKKRLPLGTELSLVASQFSSHPPAPVYVHSICPHTFSSNAMHGMPRQSEMNLHV